MESSSVPIEPQGPVAESSEVSRLSEKRMAEELAAAHGRPMKKFYRQRAHCNPLSHNDAFEYPVRPSEADWSEHYPDIENPHLKIRILDLGCGFGVELAHRFPSDLILGLEIRHKVCQYVHDRILNLRDVHPGEYQNVAVLKTNAMRYLPNYISKSQLEKIFICFADPHFKINNHRRRIVSPVLLSEYSFFLKPHGRIYTITDVADLYQWHLKCAQDHPNFRVVPPEDYSSDPCVDLMMNSTEEGQKVTRNGGEKHIVVMERLEDSEISSPVLVHPEARK